MSIYFGNDKIASVFKGTNKIGSAFYGSNKVYSSSRVPSGYTQVGWLQSDSNQYILTSVVPTATTYIKGKFKYTYKPSSDLGCILGARSHNYKNGIMLWLSSNAYTIYSSYGGETLTDSSKIYITLNADYNFELNNHSLKVGDSEVQFTTGSSLSSNFPFCIFAFNNAGSIQRKTPSRIYHITIGNSTGDQINLIPCIRNSDSKPGMWDTVSQTFLTNSGTGEFTTGS